MPSKQKNELAQIVAYTPPRLYTGKEWYIGFMAYDPIQEKLHREGKNYIILSMDYSFFRF